MIPHRKVLASDKWADSADDFVGLSATDKWFRELYDPQGSERYANAPVGVQIVTRRFQEERLLRIIARVEASLTSAAVREVQSAQASFANQRLPQKDRSSSKVTALDDVVAVAA